MSLRAYIDVSHQASVQNIQLESRTPGDSDFLVEVYRAGIVNAGAALERVSATIRGTPEHVLVVDGSLAFGDVPAHATRPGKNTFKIERKASVPFDVSSLQWRIESHKTQGQVRLSDAGPKDAKTGDGLYTAAFTPAVPGMYTALAKVHGTAGGNAFARSSETTFQVNPPTASFISFEDHALDDNANGATDSIVTKAIVSGGFRRSRYRFAVAAFHSQPEFVRFGRGRPVRTRECFPRVPAARRRYGCGGLSAAGGFTAPFVLGLFDRGDPLE